MYRIAAHLLIANSPVNTSSDLSLARVAGKRLLGHLAD